MGSRAGLAPAEETGLIDAIGSWVLETACARLFSRPAPLAELEARLHSMA